MREGEFFILDVFCEEKYSGNQLAVVRPWPGMSIAEMQNIAKEMNFSETAFIISDNTADGAYPARIFTPSREVPFAGHPTLGTAFVIQQEILRMPVKEISVGLGAGNIPVGFVYDEYDRPHILRMRQNPPEFGLTVPSAEAARALGLEAEDISEWHPVEEVSTGLWFLVAPVRSLDALKRIKLNMDAYEGLVKGLKAKGLMCFTPNPRTPETDISLRMFAPQYGITEDPATGSGAGCVAAYIIKNHVFPGDFISLIAGQGHEIGRPSILRIEAKKTASGIEVHVGGRVIPVARGTLL